MEKEKWMYNETEDLWMNCETFDTREGAIQGGKEEYKGEQTFFFVGKQKALNYTPCVDVERVLEDISEKVYDEVGEVSEDYLDYVKKEDLEELERKMNAVLIDWMKTHKHEPSYYLVTNSEEVSVI